MCKFNNQWGMHSLNINSNLADKCNNRRQLAMWNLLAMRPLFIHYTLFLYRNVPLLTRIVAMFHCGNSISKWKRRSICNAFKFSILNNAVISRGGLIDPRMCESNEKYKSFLSQQTGHQFTCFNCMSPFLFSNWVKQTLAAWVPRTVEAEKVQVETLSIQRKICFD